MITVTITGLDPSYETALGVRSLIVDTYEVETSVDDAARVVVQRKPNPDEVSTRGNEALVPDDMVTVSKVLAAASDLLSEDGENPEYDRGVVELVCDTLGFHMDTKEHVLIILRALR